MRNEDLTTRNNILKTTFELISEEGEDMLTVRKIADRAGVAVSAVNYHFQTKENLIEMAVEFGIGFVISSFLNMYKSLKGKPVNKLKKVVKATFSFIMENQNISRLSMLNDLKRGFGHNDNITQSTNALKFILTEVFNGKSKSKNELEISLKSYQISTAIHFAFFRKAQIKIETGLDMEIEKDRNTYLDNIINYLIPD